MDNDAHRDQEEQSTKRRASLLGMRYFDTRTLQKLPLFPDVIPVSDMYKFYAVPLINEDGRIVIAVTTRTPQPVLAELTDRFPDQRVSFVLVSETAIRDFMLLYDPPEEVKYDDIELSPGGDDDNVANISATLNTVHADDMFDYLVRQGKRLNASDIHLECQDEMVRVRIRVDGVLHPIAELTYEKYRQLNSTIAIQANISTGSPEPQTGHIGYNIDGELLNMRIETVPTTHGQDAVIRIFHLDIELLDVQRLGLNDEQEQVISEVISHPTGLVLSVGPTGSGKTTTLYTIIRALNDPTRKIITLEDPVEFSLPGIVQIPVETMKGDSFADKFRAVMRLDPDIVMVGEIRDIDTARTALQASLSGHLVLSTFHASDASAACTRLMDMVGDNPLFASAIRLIIAQRLVRRLEDKTKEEYSPDEEWHKKLVEELSALPQTIEKPDFNNLKLFRPKPTPELPFGYNGQLAIVELLTMTDTVRELLRKGSMDLTAGLIEAAARKDGMITMRQDGLLKALAGRTSVDEIYRVV